ncbi:hypothetical protein PHYBLDRAFT_162418 [Phycomyces blakesleeanus NRRL 1555(-)]|uniref:Endonuclease/exonuclease/phosphatase domain-containing protein n=1 Tax=Phycomyces blakesleeanus (strain ATCC 8743b / DSM 1359 / FGSC 10004 / NBRC 33097 / NRRL 1555) TaxID=763407 RepID=A0A167Q9Y0_PHYB8|nr:hypothetical protein PHYBLDRAFT_162418 [Phycomyces blakesleeanus NRRL 1555(-)]OAD79344.1 hypothetical protein PHYBLDRAFT_162418 [Phycomyces blakesleeanus NRRL 1555(-)]|eukprot:XP_018297384.1 hypothetical protein PHYBLDRAFT_162418 [Phycomyces blakesleeanus NRRL 1555(-)]
MGIGHFFVVNVTGSVPSSASLPASQSTADVGTATSTWATKTSLILPAKTPRVSSAGWVAASQRLFSDKTGPDGFEYVYIPRSRRIMHSEVHRSLRTLGADTGRLLDINFPACEVIGILVHVQYLEEFKSQLASAKVSLVNNFDPLDPKNVADPKFANLSVSGLETQALVLQNARCLQALKFLRSHLVLLVAHFFVQSGWIGLEEIPARPVGLWNANGLQPRAIKDMLNHYQSLHMLFITETWLLSPARLPTSWSQFHLYGSPVAGNYRRSMGVSLLVSPSCSYAVTQIPMPNNYALAVKIGTLRLICLYLPPSMPTHEALDILSAIPLTDDIIICGDFNARLGSVTGDYASNPRGVALEQWLEERSLTVFNGVLSPCTPTYISFCNEVEISSIIDLFITNTNFANPSLHIATELSLGSDHRLLSLSFTYNLQHSPPAPPPMRQTWNLSHLHEDDVRSLYVTTIATKSISLLVSLQDLVQNLPTICPLIDALTNSFNTLIYDSLSSSIGSRPPCLSHWKSFWTPALQAAADHRDGCYKQWRRACGIDKINWWSRHQHAHKEFCQQVQTAKHLSWHAFCHSMNLDFNKAMSKIKQSKWRRQPQHTFQHDDSPAVAATVMCDHLALVYSGHILPDIRPPPPPLNTSLMPFASVDSPFTSPVVETFMQFMPNRNVPALATMATLNAVGACQSGFSLLFSSHLYRIFIRPKFEYGLTILPLRRTDTIQLEKIQDKCLRMIIGRHRISSTTVLKHICHLPSMSFRADVLITKFCIRAHYLPSGCLLSLLHHHHSQSSSLVTLRHNTLLQSIPIDLNFKTDQLQLSSNQVLFLVCRPLLEVDPILFLPATRVERSCLVCWRMGWLPGTSKNCPCGTDHTSRHHLAVCSLVPAHSLACLPIPSDQNCNPIDVAITALPYSSQAPCPSYWVALLTILWHFDKLCNPDGDYTHETHFCTLWAGLS